MPPCSEAGRSGRRSISVSTWNDDDFRVQRERREERSNQAVGTQQANGLASFEVLVEQIGKRGGATEIQPPQLRQVDVDILALLGEIAQLGELRIRGAPHHAGERNELRTDFVAWLVALFLCRGGMRQ